MHRIEHAQTPDEFEKNYLRYAQFCEDPAMLAEEACRRVEKLLVSANIITPSEKDKVIDEIEKQIQILKDPSQPTTPFSDGDIQIVLDTIDTTKSPDDLLYFCIIGALIKRSPFKLINEGLI